MRSLFLEISDRIIGDTHVAGTGLSNLSSLPCRAYIPGRKYASYLLLMATALVGITKAHITANQYQNTL
jgi:hypothetical protein